MAPVNQQFVMRCLGAWCALLIGCAKDPVGPEEALVDCSSATGRYMSLVTGTSWSYTVIKPNGTHTKTQTVGALEDVGGTKAGVMAYRLTTIKPGGMVISWQEDTGMAITRHREQDLAGSTSTDEIYLPHHTRIDEAPEHIVVGATWTETFDEVVKDMATGQMKTVRKVDTWTVEADDAGIHVPAGDFCTLRVARETRVNGLAGASKHYWFARGVGKIREQNIDGDVEELTAFTP